MATLRSRYRPRPCVSFGIIRFTGSCAVSRPVEAVFDALADMAELHRWNPNVTSSSRLTGARLEVGSTYESVIRRGPLRLVAASTLTAIEPPHAVEYQGTIGSFWSIDRLTFASTAHGTEVTFFNESRPPTWLKPLNPLLNAAFQPQARRAVAGAHRFLTG